MSLDLQMILTRIDAVMIDLDGTMVDTMGDFEAALNLCLADIDLPKVSPAVVNIAVGKGSDHHEHEVDRRQHHPRVIAGGLNRGIGDRRGEARFLERPGQAEARRDQEQRFPFDRPPGLARRDAGAARRWQRFGHRSTARDRRRRPRAPGAR